MIQDDSRCKFGEETPETEVTPMVSILSLQAEGSVGFSGKKGLKGAVARPRGAPRFVRDKDSKKGTSRCDF